MDIFTKVFAWIKSFFKRQPIKLNPSEFKLANPAWNKNRITYKGVFRVTKVYKCIHYLECRILTAKESKEYWEPKISIKTHWVTFAYITPQGTHIYLINKPFSFIPKGFHVGGAFNENSIAKEIIRRVAKRAVEISNEPTFTMGTTFSCPSRELFLRDRDNRSSQFWEAVLEGEFNHYVSRPSK